MTIDSLDRRPAGFTGSKQRRRRRSMPYAERLEGRPLLAQCWTKSGLESMITAWRIEYRPAANIHGLAAALRFVIHEPRRNRFVTSVLSLHLESQARKPTQPDGQHGDH